MMYFQTQTDAVLTRSMHELERRAKGTWSCHTRTHTIHTPTHTNALPEAQTRGRC
eukprot:18745_5